MRKRVYHHFPVDDVEFTQNYSFWGNLPYLVKTLAAMNNRSGSMTLTGNTGQVLDVKRNIKVDIAEANVDFKSLAPKDLDAVLEGIENNGMLDFRINILYSRLNKDYSRVAFNEDTFLVRCELNQRILILKIHKLHGPGHTTCSEIASTMVDEIIRGDEK
ncbi:MAG: hypothetical protein M8349_02455 [ANME-2 cluster archaeon]|nr:hypothetical protein [ANME-2 cluster archaeon]